MRLSAVEEHEIDELPPAVAYVFERYVAASLALAWNLSAWPRDGSGPPMAPIDLDTVKAAQARFIGLLNHQKEWRWGGSTWRLGMYGVERVAG